MLIAVRLVPRAATWPVPWDEETAADTEQTRTLCWHQEGPMAVAGAVVLVAYFKLSHALYTSIKAQKLGKPLEHSELVWPSLPPSALVQEAHRSPVPGSDTLPQ